VAGSFMSMKKHNDIIGNRTRDLPACSAVPHPTAPPRAPPLENKNGEKGILSTTECVFD
jgi:hypothetical protein